MPVGIDGCLCAVGQVQLTEDVAYVGLDRFFADAQRQRYLAVVHPLGNEAQDLHLAGCEVVGNRLPIRFWAGKLLYQFL